MRGEPGKPKYKFTAGDDEGLIPGDIEKRIPKMPYEELEELNVRIRPVVRFKGKLHYVDPKPDIINDFYLQDAKPLKQAENLEEFKRITTWHVISGYEQFFRPVAAEVLAQIEPEDRDTVVAYEILTENLSASNIVGRDYHVATTILYRKKQS